ncbi:uncharacterized protein LOC124897897 [Capsicum annuum]|uniref:uncharacterized protein LOC124897897 n=1 Tax=Capsicum annuum TaxID=4072 RepID=UPI001FB123FE|nr:uncharacterized protein LOC124897897 [Capsicum annuum]
MTFEKPKQWPQWLPLAAWWYNTTYHTATHLTPFEEVYGQKPPLLLPYISFDSALVIVDRSLQARETTIRDLKSYLEKDQGRMKIQDDRKRTDWTYTVGDQEYFPYSYLPACCYSPILLFPMRFELVGAPMTLVVIRTTHISGGRTISGESPPAKGCYSLILVVLDANSISDEIRSSD